MSESGSKFSVSNDPAIVNLPLSARGDIDRQLDAYKRDQAAASRAAIKASNAERKADGLIAKELVRNIAADKLQRIADKAGITVAAARKNLMSDAHWNPALIIRCLGGEA